MLHSLLATREPSEEVDNFLDDSGVGPLLKQLYALEDLEGLCKELKRILRQEKTARSQASKAKAAAKNAKSTGSTNHVWILPQELAGQPLAFQRARNPVWGIHQILAALAKRYTRRAQRPVHPNRQKGTLSLRVRTQKASLH